MGEHSHSQGYLKESEVNISRLSWAMWGERERGEEGRERGEGNRGPTGGGQGTGGEGCQNVWIIYGRASGGSAAHVQTFAGTRFAASSQ